MRHSLGRSRSNPTAQKTLKAIRKRPVAGSRTEMGRSSSSSEPVAGQAARPVRFEDDRREHLDPVNSPLAGLTRVVPSLLARQHLGEAMRPLTVSWRAPIQLATEPRLAIPPVEPHPRPGMLGPRAYRLRRTPRRIRTTNLLERTFVEVRRRTKVIGRFPGETSALSLIWAVLELSSRGWRGVVMTPKTVAEIERLRRQQASADTHDTEEVIAAPGPPSQNSTTNGTSSPWRQSAFFRQIRLRQIRQSARPDRLIGLDRTDREPPEVVRRNLVIVRVL
jgi:mutator family transposase